MLMAKLGRACVFSLPLCAKDNTEKERSRDGYTDRERAIDRGTDRHKSGRNRSESKALLPPAPG